jgi:exopolysaccharide production protein ExoZ
MKEAGSVRSTRDVSKSRFIFPLHDSLPLPSSLRQIDGLQALRALAVALVAWAHATQQFYPPGINGAFQFGVFGIDIFFVISGFILSSVVLRERRKAGMATMWEFLKRRILRIFPLYWIIATMELVRIALHHDLFRYNYLPAFFLFPPFTTIFFAPIVGVSWTLNFEMIFYYLLASLLIVTVRRAIPTMIAVLALAVVIGALVGIRRPFVIVVCNPMLLEFIFGALLALVYTRVPGVHSRAGRRVGLGVLLVGIAFAVYLWVYPPAGAATGLQMVLWDLGIFRRVFTYGIAAMLLVGGTVCWSPSLSSRPGRWLLILGNASYSAYLVSERIIDYSNRLLLKLFGFPNSWGRQFVYESVMVALVAGGGWLCYELVEWPMTRWLQAKFLIKPKKAAVADTGG